MSVPSAEKRSREVLVGEQRPHGGLGEDGAQEPGRDLAPQETVAVLGEHGRVPDRVVHAQANEPAEQQVAVELPHEPAFRAHRVERLQEQGPPQQLPGRDGGPPARGVQEALELARGRGDERSVDDRQDGPQRVVGGHPPFATHVREQAFRPLVAPPHSRPPHRG
jgi:hypothetical protein